MAALSLADLVRRVDVSSLAVLGAQDASHDVVRGLWLAVCRSAKKKLEAGKVRGRRPARRPRLAAAACARRGNVR